MTKIEKFFSRELPNSENPKLFLEEALSKSENFPQDLYKSIGFEQNKFHDEDLFSHLTNAYQIGLVYSNDPIFAMICLFHDIGKVRTRSWSKEKKDWTFHRHEYVGAEFIWHWMMQNKFPLHDIRRVYLGIKEHQYRVFDNTSNKAIRRWLKLIGQQCWEDVRILRLVDRMANQANRNKPVIYNKYIEVDNRISDQASLLYK